MGSVYEKRSKWYLRYKDAHGRWLDKPTRSLNKTAARRLLAEVEQKVERQRLGLDALPDPDGGGTIAELMAWWLKTYSATSASQARNTSVVTKHLIAAPIGRLTLAQLTSGKLEEFLQSKTSALGPQSINHLRRYISRAFGKAIDTGRWSGDNPAKRGKPRRVPKALPSFLRASEVPALFMALPKKWRPLFATALYTGLRKGELLGLRKADVDFENHQIAVAQRRTPVLPFNRSRSRAWTRMSWTSLGLTAPLTRSQK